MVEIERIDLLCEVNNTDHNTQLNGVDRLIVRRGQPFTIHLHLRAGTHFQNGANVNFIAKTGLSFNNTTNQTLNQNTTVFDVFKHVYSDIKITLI